MSPGCKRCVKLREEFQAFNRVPLLRPRNQVRIFYEDSDEDSEVISRARNEGVRATIEDAVTVSYAEDLLSRRYGEEVKIFVKIGGRGGDKPLLWQPGQGTSLQRLARYVRIRFTYKKVDALHDF